MKSPTVLVLLTVASLFIVSFASTTGSPTELKRTSSLSGPARQRPRLEVDTTVHKPDPDAMVLSPPNSPRGNSPSSPFSSKKHAIVYLDGGAVQSMLLKERASKVAMMRVEHAKQISGIGKSARPAMAGMTVQNDASAIRTLTATTGLNKLKWYKREVVEYDSSATAGAPSGFTNVAVSKDFHSSSYKTYRPGLPFNEDDTAGTRKCQIPGDTNVKQTFYFVNSEDPKQRFFVIRRSGFEIEKKGVNVAPSGGFPTGVDAKTPFPVATHPGEKCEDPAHYAKLHLAMDFTVTKRPLSGSHTFKCPPMNGDAVKQSEKTMHDATKGASEFASWMECSDQDEFTVEGGEVTWIDDSKTLHQSICVKHTFPQDRDWTPSDPSAYCCVPDCVVK